MSIVASIGIAVGLTAVALVAVTAGSRRPDRPPGALAVVGASMTYLVVVLPLLTVGGLNLATWIGFVVLVCAAIAAAYARAHGTRLGSLAPGGTAGAETRRVVVSMSSAVSVGLIAVLLIAAAQTLSLLGRVNPVVATVVVAVVAALVALANGVRGTARAGRWLFWVLVAVSLPILAAGLYLGRPGDLVAPVVPVESLSLAGTAALVIAVLALGFTDPALATYLRSSTLRGAGWAIVLTAVLLLVGGVGLLLVFGGVLIAPSLAFFTLPANLWTVPATLVATMAVVAFLMASTIASLASSAVAVITGPPDEPSGKPTPTAATQPAPPSTVEPAAAVLDQPAPPSTVEPAAPSTREPAAPPTREPAAPPTREPAAPPTREPAAPPTRIVAWMAGLVAVSTLIAVLPTTAAHVVFATALVATAGTVALLVAAARETGGGSARPLVGLVAGIVIATVGIVVVVVIGSSGLDQTGLIVIAATALVTAAGTVMTPSTTTPSTDSKADGVGQPEDTTTAG